MNQKGQLISPMCFILAFLGESAQALEIADNLAQRYPKGTLLRVRYVPTARTLIAVHRGYPSGAIDLLRAAEKYEYGHYPYFVGLPFATIYTRGRAYLAMDHGDRAKVEFNKILDHRGVYPASPFYPLAQLGAARALALEGDEPESRKAYQDFFALWKDADPDIPILLEARKEYEELQRTNSASN